MAMLETNLKKIEVECERLSQELATLQKADPITVACKALLEYVEGQPEPFSASYTSPNPWITTSVKRPGCCTIA